MASSGEAYGMEESSSSTPKISLLDHVNGFHYNALKKSDNFVIDMDAFAHGINKDSTNNANSRITKSLSRKGSQRGGCGAEKKSNSNANDRDATLAASSPRVLYGVKEVGDPTVEKVKCYQTAGSTTGPSTPEKPAGAAIGSTDIPQVHHQITITTGNIITTPDSKSGFRRNSLKRSSHSWAIDPKRVLLFFATLWVYNPNFYQHALALEFETRNKSSYVCLRQVEPGNNSADILHAILEAQC
ncbi:hypothetical protein KPL71_005556 [Citrus sinensis]|uniref:Uncharacterized protein n=1 Tax=Citrus sinensis TaxID=2711 RepID=A0ACB8NF94_CITSI|nr:hypothetical protein KPL71_005556 [Citrus sinensis]